jgi:hypothetical protein
MLMRGHWYTMAIAVGAVALVVAAGTVVVLTATSAPPVAVHLALTIEFNPTSWYLTFTPTSFQAPANSIIQFTITNYDPTTHGVVPAFCNVTGTVNASMAEVEQLGGSSVKLILHALAADQVSHTFTMISGGYDLNVPIPAALSSQSPSVVVFSFQTLGSGVSTWTSEAVVDGPHGSSGTVTGFFQAS